MDGKIFLIALMLSSVLLYNSFGVIDKASLRKLQLICFSGKKLDKNFSPSSLVWVLRDFCLLLENENEGGSIGTNEYLENALAQDHIIKEVFKRR